MCTRVPVGGAVRARPSAGLLSDTVAMTSALPGASGPGSLGGQLASNVVGWPDPYNAMENIFDGTPASGLWSRTVTFVLVSPLLM